MAMIKFSPGNCCCDTVNCATECCDTGSITNTMELDFGTNVLTDNECSSCNEVGGAFQLEANADCEWSASFDYSCGSENEIDCAPAANRNYNGYRLIFLAILNAAFCNFTISVSVEPLMDGVPVDLEDSCDFGGGASYFWNGAAGTNKFPCDAAFDMDLVSSGSWGNFCSDNFPATVSVTFV